MSMKKPYSIGMILLLFGLLHGCLFPAMWSNPGYMISIEIQKVNKKDAVLVESVLREHNFNVSKQHVTGERCVWYKKEIHINGQIEYPYIKAAVCFDEIPGQDITKDFRILIMNEWQGKAPQLKHEIDSIADILIAELKKLVGEENIKVERKATGPPF